MSLETEVITSPIDTKFFFPKKEDILGQITFPKVEVYSNHFTANFDKQQKFNEWHLSFFDKKDIEQYKADPNLVQNPVPEDSRELILDIFRFNRKKLYSELGCSFHTGHTLYTVGRTNDISDEYIYEEHSNYAMVVKLKNKGVDFQSLVPNETCRKQLLRFLNSNLKKILFFLKFYEFGRLKKYFNIDLKRNIPQHSLEIFTGYKTAFEFYEGGVKLLIDTTCRILRTKSLWQEFIEADIESSNKEKIREFFIGQCCQASYANNKKYRIDDVEFNVMVSDPFPDKTFANYLEYYEKKYNRKIKYVKQFMLVSKTEYKKKDENGKLEILRNNVLVVPELLQGTGMTDRQKTDYRVMNDVGKETIKTPDEKFRKINDLADEISNYKEKGGFQMTIDTKSNKIVGYKIPYPKLKTDREFFPEQRIRINSLYKSKKLKNWIIFYDFRHKRDIDTIIGNMSRCSSRYKLDFRKPEACIELPRNIRAKDLDRLYQGKDPKVILFIVSKQTARYLYKAAKAFYQRKGVVTQFFTSYNFRRDAKNLSKFSNLLLQIIVKLGGILWNFRTKVENSATFGVNITRAKQSSKKQNMVTVVSQMGTNFKHNYSQVGFQTNEEETVHDLVSKQILTACKHYFKKQKKHLQNLIIYRNALNERELNIIIDKEICQIAKLMKEEFKDKCPKICVIMVTKKINDRFAIKTQRGLQNPFGLVVTDQVVKADRFNFYMIPQFVNQGTATPAHYQMLFNDTSLTKEQIIELTFGFTYNYMNWMGPIRVPSTLQYAEKLGAQVSITGEEKIARNLRKVLFYL